MKDKTSLKNTTKPAIISVFFVYLVLFAITQLVPNTFYTQIASAASTSSPQDQINTNNQKIAGLNQKIRDYEAELTQIGADKETLNNAIASLIARRNKIEAKIQITQHQIDTTKLQIQQLGQSIENTRQSVATNQKILSHYMQRLHEADGKSLLASILSSGSLATAWTDVTDMSQIQTAIQGKVKTLQTQEKELSQTKDTSQQKQVTLTSQKKSLASQQTSLIQTKNSKSQLLVETDAKESKYQQLLAAAKAQLTSFTAFTKNAGGSGLLKNQTSCDTWGCYYNQRDALWGNIPLNGTKYRFASDGCLVTAMAMVMTHYGYSDVTPATINADPSNFAAYYPAYILYTIHVDGKTVTRVSAPIDATLATGNPVIIGLHAYGGTHFVVLVSGKNGHYIMRDPYIANGKDINFSDHYSMNQIYVVNKVVIN